MKPKNLDGFKPMNFEPSPPMTGPSEVSLRTTLTKQINDNKNDGQSSFNHSSQNRVAHYGLLNKSGRAALEQNLLKEGAKDPQNVVAFYTDSPLLRRIVASAQQLLNWHLVNLEAQKKKKVLIQENLIDLLLTTD